VPGTRVLRPLARCSGGPEHWARISSSWHHGKVTPPLTEKYGFTSADIGYFEVHWKTDRMHSARAYELISKHATSSELRAECIARVARATDMRWLFTDGIYRAFVIDADAERSNGASVSRTAAQNQ
jgi:pyrroloquinoline quinone (PQQ) biosynthesis protein C